MTIYRGKQETTRHHGEKIFTSTLTEKKTQRTPHELMSRLNGGKHEIYWTSKFCDPHSDSYRVAFSYSAPSYDNIGYTEIVPPGKQLSSSICATLAKNKKHAKNIKFFLDSNVNVALRKLFHSKSAPGAANYFYDMFLPEIPAGIVFNDEDDILEFMDLNKAIRTRLQNVTK